ncbi:type II secretion system F family protein [Coprococcus catus]
MSKKRQEPQYVMSVLNTPMLNYKVYIMSGREKRIAHLVTLLIGGIVGLTFYGGQFKDVDGIATTATMISNVVIFFATGIITNRIYLPIHCKNLCEKRRLLLTMQFRSFLEALAVSLSSGMNMTESMLSAYNDLKVEYSDNAYIVAEVKEMLEGIQNNIPIENMLESLGERSQIDDIKNFGVVFDICYRAGGNMKDIVRRTSNIISEKIEINEEIETALASNKTQFNAMMCIPVIMMLLLRIMSSQFSASFATVPGIIAITIAIGIFGIAYKLGLKIMNVKG